MSTVKRLKRTLAILTIASSIAGCVGLQVASAGVSAISAYYSHKVYVSPAQCEWVQPIYLEGELQGLTREDKESIVIHNEYYLKFCGKGG